VTSSSPDNSDRQSVYQTVWHSADWSTADSQWARVRLPLQSHPYKLDFGQRGNYFAITKREY
jgi:hypothetical protein